MALVRGICLALSFLIAVVTTAVRYDVITPVIVGQLVAGNEFEWMVWAYVLALIGLCLRRRA